MNQTPGPGAEKPSGRDVTPQQKKVLHFSSGEILTVDDSEEEEGGHELHPQFCASDQGNWTWKERSWFWVTRVLKMSLGICDLLGERMAALLGLNAAKYQYIIDQCHRDQQNGTGRETFSTSIKGNKEEIHLSQVMSKPYGSTNTQDFREQKTPEEIRDRKHKDNVNCETMCTLSGLRPSDWSGTG